MEIALEFANVLKEKNISNEECRVSLIEQLPDVLPNMDSFLVEQTRNACDALDVKRYHGAFVNEIKDKTIFLSDSRTIEFDMVLFLIRGSLDTGTDKPMESAKLIPKYNQSFVSLFVGLYRRISLTTEPICFLFTR